jgi:hypothetical protein
VFLQVGDRIFDGSLPFKTQVAIPGLDRQPCDLGRPYAWSVHIELPVTQPVNPAMRPLYERNPYYFFVEFIGPIPIGNVDDAVIKLRRHHTDFPDLS